MATRVQERGAPGRDDSGPPAGLASRWPQIVATSLGFGVVQLDVSVVNVAIKPIGDALGGGTSALQWVVSAYTVVFAALILTSGALGDRIGAKRVFVAGFAIFTTASMACGLAPSLGVLIAARAIQGVGAAALVPCSLALLTHAFPDAAERAKAVGLWAAGASTGLAGGPLVGGILTQAFGWRAIFFINLPIGLVAIWLTLTRMAETPRTARRGLDLAGQAAAIVTLAALAAAVIEGGARGFDQPLVLAGFLATAIAAALFLTVERRRTDPMLPLALFRSVTFSASTAIGLVVNVGFYGLIFLLSLWFQGPKGYTALQTGLAFAPSTVAVVAANLLTGRIVARIGPVAVMIAGSLLMAVGYGALLVVSDHTAFAALVVQLVVVGFGLGLVVPSMTTELLGSVETTRSGLAAGTLNTARQTGSVLGVALFGAFVAGGLVHALDLALVLALALSLAAAALAEGIRRAEDR
ncbi:MAG: MFS transporter [Patulibacter sp.]|nr:MFS transporter [Patulibacter sp.]